MPPFLTALTIGHTNPASKFHHLTFQVDQSEDFNYMPGQYIALQVAPNRINKYSLASYPQGNKIDLFVDVFPGGIGSQYIKNLAIGDEVKFVGPLGNFAHQPEDQATELIFMATGSGVSPLKAIVEQLVHGEDRRPMAFYFGLRYPEDVFLKAYFERLVYQHPNFKFFLSLSKPDEKWEGEIGHITELIKRDVSQGDKLAAYLCGAEEMLNEAQGILLSLGTPEQRIYQEKFY